MSSYANSGRRSIDAATFLKGKATLAEGPGCVPPVIGTGSQGVTSIDAPVATASPSASGASEPVSEQSPPLIFKDTTPSGIVVEYEAKPKRLYRVNGTEVPSVTTVLGSLNKPGLSYWGNKIGVDGVLELVRRGLLFQAVDWHND